MRTRPDPTPAPGDSALRGAVLRDLAGPLAALRASLESLAHDTEPPSPARLLRRALAEVVRLERRVEALAGLVGTGARDPWRRAPDVPLPATLGALAADGACLAGTLVEEVRRLQEAVDRGAIRAAAPGRPSPRSSGRSSPRSSGRRGDRP